jgi:hypothetical protein
MSPFRDMFVNFVHTRPVNIKCANNRSFAALGYSDIVTTMPNGERETRVTLKNALYAPSMSFTLVSIAAIEMAEHKALFWNGACHIITSTDTTIGQIVHSPSTNLYCVEIPHQIAQAYVTTTILTIDQAHRALGHVGHSMIQSFVSKGLVQGVQIDPTSQASQCHACIQAKITHAPIPKE